MKWRVKGVDSFKADFHYLLDSSETLVDLINK